MRARVEVRDCGKLTAQSEARGGLQRPEFRREPVMKELVAAVGLEPTTYGL
jgi:hypothetical protein